MNAGEKLVYIYFKDGPGLRQLKQQGMIVWWKSTYTLYIYISNNFNDAKAVVGLSSYRNLKNLKELKEKII